MQVTCSAPKSDASVAFEQLAVPVNRDIVGSCTSAYRTALVGAMPTHKCSLDSGGVTATLGLLRNPCQPIPCVDPGFVIGARRQFAGNDTVLEQRRLFHSGEAVKYVCNTGTALSGTATLTCGLGGNWDNALPSCAGK